MAAKIKYEFDGLQGSRYVRCRRGRTDYEVQVWNSSSPEGEPDGDWSMPKALGVRGSIFQALLQTPKGE